MVAAIFMYSFIHTDSSTILIEEAKPKFFLTGKKTHISTNTEIMPTHYYHCLIRAVIPEELFIFMLEIIFFFICCLYLFYIPSIYQKITSNKGFCLVAMLQWFCLR